MTAAHERILTRISDAELERRWAAVRAQMRSRGVGAIVTQNASDWVGGYVRWFTDLPANNGYPRTVVFHVSDPMTVVEMGPFGVVRKLGGCDPLHRGVGQVLCSPSFVSVAPSHNYDADRVVEDLKPRDYKTIGFLGPGMLPHALVSRLKTGLGGSVDFVDVTDWVDAIKAVKSAEEIALIRRCASMQDQVFAKVLKVIKPGLRDIDVTAAAQAEGQRLGSEQGIFLGASAKVGVRSPFAPRLMQGRTLEKGDHLSLLIENNGPGGFYTEIARTIVLGKAGSELKEGFAAVKAAQDYTLSLMKPGAKPADIHAAHNAYMKERGLPPEMRLYAHSQGYDMVERPLIRQDEPMTLAENMNFAVHPGYETESIFAVICDNYLVTKTGVSPCLHQTAKQVFEVVTG
jgi:Xaa-Pro aminopeptidase